MKINGVFEGGGIRAIGIIGAINCFDDNNITWNKLAGTSSGAIMAALLASGFTGKEINKLIINTNFLKFMDRNSIQKIPLVGRQLGILRDKSIYSGDYMEEYFYNVFAAKNIYTFADLKENGEYKVKFVASDITRKKELILPDDLPYYGINPDEFSVAKALRMSCSIPFYFKPVILNREGIEHFIVDGSVIINYPIEIFDNDDDDDVKTVGFKYEEEELNSYTAAGKKDPLSFLYDIAASVPSENKRIHLLPQNIKRTILIPTKGVSSTDFELSRENGMSLYKAGYRSANKYIDKIKE
ncbi:MAG: patatin-like phospholipase family protein [Clostridiaceae bacterium]